MDQEQIENIIRRAISKNVDLNETLVFLFGSRALGEGRLGSDFDVGLYKGERIPLRTIAKISAELDEFPIPMDVDIVDFFSVSEEFKKLALKVIKVWNKPKKNLKLI